MLSICLESKNIRLNLSEAAVDALADKGYDSKMGARPLSRKIDELLRVPLSKKILFERLSDCSMQVDWNGKDMQFEIAQNSVVGADENGIIRV